MKELKDLIEAAKNCHYEVVSSLGADLKTIKKMHKAVVAAEAALKRAKVFEGYANPVLLDRDFGTETGCKDGWYFDLMMLRKKETYCKAPITIIVIPREASDGKA